MQKELEMENLLRYRAAVAVQPSSEDYKRQVLIDMLRCVMSRYY